MKQGIASLVLAIVFCGHGLIPKSVAAFAAQGPGSPSGMMNPSPEGPPGLSPGGQRAWWKDPEVVKKLHISDDQVQKIEKIAQDHQIQAIDLHADLEKQEAALRFQMEADAPNESQVFGQIDKVTQARARLEKSQVEMMLAVRHVLTDEQAKLLRDMRPAFAPPRPGSAPPHGDEGGPHNGPPEGGPGTPPDGPPEPPPSGSAN